MACNGFYATFNGERVCIPIYVIEHKWPPKDPDPGPWRDLFTDVSILKTINEGVARISEPLPAARGVSVKCSAAATSHGRPERRTARVCLPMSVGARTPSSVRNAGSRSHCTAIGSRSTRVGVRVFLP